jgi:hypothetical protein
MLTLNDLLFFLKNNNKYSSVPLFECQNKKFSSHF